MPTHTGIRGVCPSPLAAGSAHKWSTYAFPMWRVVLAFGEPKIQRIVRRQCEHCHALDTITTLLDRAY